MAIFQSVLNLPAVVLTQLVTCAAGCDVHTVQPADVYRARILKHLVEAEKSTFRGELSFQRSECTSGLTTFCAASKDYFV
jgi:hypothetical protein